MTAKADVSHDPPGFAPHLFWEIRQLARLSHRLDALPRKGGRIAPQDERDDAALEAFLLHVRSLVDFFWRSSDADARAARKAATTHGQHLVSSPRLPDAVADHYFGAPREWHPGHISLELTVTYDAVNWGVAHCSYKRLDIQEARRWQHMDLAREVARVANRFSGEAEPKLLPPVVASDIRDELVGLLDANLGRPLRIDALTPSGRSVATPGYPISKLPPATSQ